MGVKYIRNTDDATIVCKIPSDKNKSFVFKTKKFDKMNNVLLSNGFTEVSDEDLALLRAESSTFKFYEDKGRLTVADSLPHESMSSEQLITALKSENASLKKQLKDFQKADIPAEDMSKAISKVAEQQKIIEGLDAQLAAMSEELKELQVKIEEQEQTITALEEQLVTSEEASTDNAEAEK